MNSSLQSQTDPIPSECAIYNYVGEAPRHFSTPAYSVLVFNIIILVVTCPFTIVLNVLTMIAVKIKARLQSRSNIVLACLAATDAMVGIFVQPLMICFFIMTLQGETTIDVCRLRNLSKYTSNFFSFSSLAHLVLISADRYMAIKQSYSYDQIVTKTRVLIASAIAWIFTTAVLIFHFIDYNLFLSIQNSFIVVFMLLIIISTVVVYYETRRHEQQIAAQQVSVEARERFLKEKRALKLTTTIVVMVFLNYLPIISFRRMANVLKDRFSIDTVYAVHFSATSSVLVNSFLNPLIYSVRLRQFRVALIELLLKKTRLEAEEIEKKMFGPRNAAPNDETNQGGETVNARIDIVRNQGGERERKKMSTK